MPWAGWNFSGVQMLRSFDQSDGWKTMSINLNRHLNFLLFRYPNHQTLFWSRESARFKWYLVTQCTACMFLAWFPRSLNAFLLLWCWVLSIPRNLSWTLHHQKPSDFEEMNAGGPTNLSGERHCVLTDEDDCGVANSIFPNPGRAQPRCSLSREFSIGNPWRVTGHRAA